MSAGLGHDHQDQEDDHPLEAAEERLEFEQRTHGHEEEHREDIAEGQQATSCLTGHGAVGDDQAGHEGRQRQRDAEDDRTDAGTDKAARDGDEQEEVGIAAQAAQHEREDRAPPRRR